MGEMFQGTEPERSTFRKVLLLVVIVAAVAAFAVVLTLKGHNLPRTAPAGQVR